MTYARKIYPEEMVAIPEREFTRLPWSNYYVGMDWALLENERFRAARTLQRTACIAPRSKWTLLRWRRLRIAGRR